MLFKIFVYANRILTCLIHRDYEVTQRDLPAACTQTTQNVIQTWASVFL